MRLFIALPVSGEVKKIFLNWSGQLAKKIPGAPIKWTAASQCHITVEFLGDIPGNRIAELVSLITEAVRGFRPFKFAFKNIGAFPGWNNPNAVVLYANGDDGAARLRSILNKSLQKAGFVKNSRPWKPHLTLGRVKGDVQLSKEWREAAVPTASWTAGRLELVESELSPGGSKYRLVKEFPLRG